MGDGDGGDVGGRTFPILYITTPDQPPHGGVTGNDVNIDNSKNNNNNNKTKQNNLKIIGCKLILISLVRSNIGRILYK